jgi:hypothetical protein
VVQYESSRSNSVSLAQHVVRNMVLDRMSKCHLNVVDFNRAEGCDMNPANRDWSEGNS